ncbi:MAG: leucine-rich repeat protein, partial [Acutalibacteraceae bacterium]
RINSFGYCTALESVRFPNAASISATSAFEHCDNLKQVRFPKLESVGTQCFWYSGLIRADFSVLSSIGNFAFWSTPLEMLIIRSETLCTLANTNSFGNTPIAAGTGYVYVPSALVDEYQSATNWTAYSAQIRAIEDYPEITGGTI